MLTLSAGSFIVTLLMLLLLKVLLSVGKLISQKAVFFFGFFYLKYKEFLDADLLRIRLVILLHEVQRNLAIVRVAKPLSHCL